MGYEVLALKYRPQVFEDCVGQEEVARTLKNAIVQDRVGHAYLFTGPRGVGKTSLARIFAKVLNCPNTKDGVPCNTCTQCVSISKCANMDVIEFDGASNNKVEDIRDLISNIHYQPVSTKYKIYIIDEVHMVTTQGFNALLKTLEEPPEHVKFIFATTELQKLPETILSRCQILSFRQIQQADIVKRLKYICEKENFQYQEEALTIIAAKARGAHRDSQSILDQAVAYSNGNLTAQSVREVTGAIPDTDLLNLLEVIFQKQETAIFPEVRSFLNKGFDLTEVCERLMEILRDIIVIQTCDAKASNLLSNTFYEEKLKALSKQSQRDAIHYMIQMLADTRFKIKNTNQAHILLEMVLLKMCHVTDLVTLADIAQDLKNKKITTTTASTPQPNTQAAQNKPTQTKNDNPLFPKKSTPTPIVSEPAIPIIHPTEKTLAFSEKEFIQNWPSLMELIKKQDPVVVDIMIKNNAQVQQVDEQSLIIQVQQAPRILSTLNTDARRQMISNQIAQMYKKILTVSFVIADGNEDPKKKTDFIDNEELETTNTLTTSTKIEPLRKNKSDIEREAINDPDIQKVMQEFNCQIVDFIIKKEI